MKNYLVFLLAIVLVQFSFGQASKNLSVLSHTTFNEGSNDVWGYVDGNGTEYALLGLQQSTKIYNLSNPASPTLVTSIPGPFSIWRDLKTHDNYAYVTNETSGGILIIDLSGLPASVVWKDTVMNNLNSAHNLYIDDGIMYIVGADIDGGGITMYDVATDPWNPVKVGAFSARYVHDVYVRNKIAYAAEINAGLLEIIDVSNPASPQVLGSKSYVNSFTHNTWLNDSSTVCFTTDELSDAYIYSWDISNPANITELDKIRSSLSSGAATPHNAHVLNDYIVTSYYKDGIQVVDAARPHNLIEVGYYDTNTLTGGGTDGCWGAYPFLPSGVVLATDIDEGFFVLDPVYKRGCYLEGTVTDSVTNLPIANADIVIQATSNITDLTDGAGDYATGTADPGTYSVTYSRFGYVSKSISTTLANGQLVIQDVELAPTPTVNYTITVLEMGTGTPIPQALLELTTGSFSFNFTADANGKVNDPNFTQGTYDVVVGKWGYRTKELTIIADANNTSVIIELEKGYYDDFYFDFGWTLFGNASAGEWERGEPDGTSSQGQPYNPDFDVPSDIGDQAYVTGNGGGFAGNDDVDGGETILKSPMFDLTGYVSPVLKYYRWFANGGGQGSTPNDSLNIYLSNGITSVNLTQLGVTFDFWVLDTFLVAQYITPTATMQLTAVCGDYSPGHLVEGAIDVFQVTEGEGVGIAEELIANGPKLNVFPNPIDASSIVSYDLGQKINGKDLSFRIMDVNGKVLEMRELVETKGEFKLNSQLPNGVYLGSLFLGEDEVKTFKVLR